MEYTLGFLEFSSFVLCGYQFLKWQKKQIGLIEFIDFIQKSTVFNPSLLKTVMDVHGPSIYQKSFKRFEEDLHFSRGVGFVQGIAKTGNPLKSILNNSSKLILSKLTSESIFSSREFSNVDSKDFSLKMVNSFTLNDSTGESEITLNTNPTVNYSKALYSIHSTSQIRSMTSSEKFFNWVIFFLNIVLSAVSFGRTLRGFKVGHKKVEKGIVLGY
jgi:hypothetical protein